MKSTRTWITAAAIGGAAALMGCQTPPPGNTGGRVDPYRSTPADEYSPEANTVTLLEFSDQVSEAIARRIAEVPEIRESPDRAAIELGALVNNTRTPSSDFAIVRRRVFGNLVNSSIVGQWADVYEAPEIVDPQYERLAPHADTSYRSGYPHSTSRYDPNKTFLLQGDFGEMVRGRQSTYLFEMTLTNLQSRRVVFNEQVVSKQRR
ncbi:MAG: hypothetical protein AAGK04_04425 [Planctomycetota bacterium]